MGHSVGCLLLQLTGVSESDSAAHLSNQTNLRRPRKPHSLQKHPAFVASLRVVPGEQLPVYV